MPRKANKHSLTALTKLNIQKELGKMLNNKHIDKAKHDLILAETHNILNNMSLEDLKQKGVVKKIISGSGNLISNLLGKSNNASPSQLKRIHEVNQIKEKIKQCEAEEKVLQNRKSTISKLGVDANLNEHQFLQFNQELEKIEQQLKLLYIDLQTLEERKRSLEDQIKHYNSISKNPLQISSNTETPHETQTQTETDIPTETTAPQQEQTQIVNYHPSPSANARTPTPEQLIQIIINQQQTLEALNRNFTQLRDHVFQQQEYDQPQQEYNQPQYYNYPAIEYHSPNAQNDAQRRKRNIDQIDADVNQNRPKPKPKPSPNPRVEELRKQLEDMKERLNKKK